MSFPEILLILISFCTYILASPLSKRQVPAFTFDGDAPFSVDAATLAAAVTCPNGTPSTDSPPVFLVHGTATTGAESWSEGYVPALAANGYAACYVTLPDRAMGDMQISSEYIAYGLHYISYLSDGLSTAVISHSQGGPDVQWALQFWPSTRSVTRAFIALSPDFRGIDLGTSNLSTICVDDLCQASIWQQSAGSHYYDALHDANFEAQVPTTVIWTETDEVVTPAQQNAQLPSAKAILAVQDLCPLRITDHVLMVVDAAAFALALDALNHDGTASLVRVLPKALTVCFEISAKNMQISLAYQAEADLDAIIDGFLLGSSRVDAEPAVMSYAEPS